MKQLTQQQTQSLLSLLSNTITVLDIQIQSLKSIKGTAWEHANKDSEMGIAAFGYYSHVRKELKLAKDRKRRIVSLIKALK